MWRRHRIVAFSVVPCTFLPQAFAETPTSLLEHLTREAPLDASDGRSAERR